MVEADEKLVRQYLLGELDEAEMSRFEERLMTEGDLFEMLEMVEDDLFDERLDDRLSSDERDRFDTYFLSTPARRERLELEQSLRAYTRRKVDSKEPAQDSTDSTSNNPARTATPENAPDAAVIPFPPAKQETRAARRPTRWYLGLAAAAVILVALGRELWPIISQRLDVSRGMAALNNAYAENPTEVRITGLNLPPASITRGTDSNKVNKIELKRAERYLDDAVHEHATSRSYQAAGRLYLAEQDFAQAITYFQQGLALDADNAQLHSDLGGALFELGKSEQLKGESGKSFESFAQSNEHLSKALELDNSLLEALFNRALCRQYLKLYSLAKEDWQNYIERDKSPDSKWADEARRRLKEIDERPRQISQDRNQLLRDFLDAAKARDDNRGWKLISQSRDFPVSVIENSLSESALDLTLQGRRSEAQEHLDALSFAGELESRRVGDSFVYDLSRLYQSATSARRASLLRARHLVVQGQDSAAKYNFDEALTTLKEAKETFARNGDECEALYVAYAMGNCYVQQSKAEAALSLFQPLAQVCEQVRYRSLLAQVLQAMSGAEQYLRNFSAAMSYTRRSIQLCDEMGNTPGEMKGRYQLGEIYRFLNNARKALDLYAQDLPVAPIYFPLPTQLWGRYFSISRAFDQLNLYTAAVDFQNEALRLALQAQASRLACRSYNYIGAILAEHGRYPEAAASIEQALDLGNSLAERKIRVEATAYSFLQLGYVYRKSGDFDKALENYDQAIRFYDELDSKFFAFTARKEKLLCCLEQKGCPSLEQEMHTVLALFEEHRAKILEESNRSTFFDAEQTIYDVAMAFEYYQKGDPERAFEYAERSRGRSLSDLVSTKAKIIDNPDNPDMAFSGATPPVSDSDIQKQMPEQAQILEYAVLQDSVLIWLVPKKGDILPVSQRIPIEELNKRVNLFHKLVAESSESDLPDLWRQSGYLYDLLIKPIEPALDRSKLLCIVPDKILNYLPFDALKSQASGEYLIQEQTRGIVLSPSASSFVTCSQRASEKACAEGEKLLSIGNPLFDQEAFPGLKDLRAAAGEAQAIASGYAAFCPLIGASATKERVLSEMEKADVIHFATHAITDEWQPLRSKLLLAKGDASERDNGVLEAYELYRLNLAKVKLVVLSACQTGVETYYEGEGMIGLSRPFIAQRVPLVVASLWPVDSDVTADLMISFHHHRKADPKPTAEALRQAQLDMLNSPKGSDHLPRNWAAFVVIGGYAEF